MNRKLTMLVSVACCCFLLTPLIAVKAAVKASPQFRAAIQGTVTDPAGAVVSGATVMVTSLETNKTQQVTTGDDGFYRVSGLAPGKYTVTVEMQGFKKKVLDDVTVAAEAPVGVNVALETGPVSEAVTVVAGEGATAVQTENANIDRAIT